MRTSTWLNLLDVTLFIIREKHLEGLFIIKSKTKTFIGSCVSVDSSGHIKLKFSFCETNRRVNSFAHNSTMLNQHRGLGEWDL